MKEAGAGKWCRCPNVMIDILSYSWHDFTKLSSPVSSPNCNEKQFRFDCFVATKFVYKSSLTTQSERAITTKALSGSAGSLPQPSINNGLLPDSTICTG